MSYPGQYGLLPFGTAIDSDEIAWPLLAPDGSASAPSYSFSDATNYGMYRNGSNIYLCIAGTAEARILANAFLLPSDSQVGFTSAGVTGTADVKLHRDSAGSLALRNGANEQAFNVYNTYTDAGNYERLAMFWSGDTAYVSSSSFGTGTERTFVVGTQGAANLYFQTSGVYRFYLDSSGHFKPGTNNVYDFGGTSDTFRNLYWGTQALGPDGTNLLPAYSFAGNPDTGIYLSGTNLGFSIDGAAKWIINSTSLFYPVADNTHSFGGPSNRIKDSYLNGLLVGRSAKTGAYTVAEGDSLISCDASSAAFTVTLPAAASHVGRVVYIKKIDSSANAVTVDGNGSETIDGALTQVIFLQYETLQIICNGTNWEIV